MDSNWSPSPDAKVCDINIHSAIPHTNYSLSDKYQEIHSCITHFCTDSRIQGRWSCCGEGEPQYYVDHSQGLLMEYCCLHQKVLCVLGGSGLPSDWESNPAKERKVSMLIGEAMTEYHSTLKKWVSLLESAHYVGNLIRTLARSNSRLIIRKI